MAHGQLCVLVLAGGFPQISLINSLKRRNIRTVLADYYENPAAKSYADVFYQISTLDVNAIRELARKEKADLIITVCTDQALLTMAQVSEDLGLPCYLNYETALNITNKQKMKKIFADNGIPTAEYFTLNDIADIRNMTLAFPLVVKPTDCNSSKGVVNVAACAPLPSQYAAIRAYSGHFDYSYIRETYQIRRDILVNELADVPGVSFVPPKAAFYAFVNISGSGMKSEEFAYSILEREHLAVVPGIAYGEGYDDYIRLAFTVSNDSLREAMKRFKRFMERVSE